MQIFKWLQIRVGNMWSGERHTRCRAEFLEKDPVLPLNYAMNVPYCANRVPFTEGKHRTETARVTDQQKRDQGYGHRFE